MIALILLVSIGTSMLLDVLLARKCEIDLNTAFAGGALIGLVAAALTTAVSLVNSGLTVYALVLVALMVSGGLTILLALLRFYRDPDRSFRGDPGCVVSPADGRVVYVNRVRTDNAPEANKKGRMLRLPEVADLASCGSEAYQIGIAMNVLDVHVNRSPIEGMVMRLHRTPGSFLSLKRPEAFGENERFTTIIDNGSLRVAVVQIASRMVRRIVTYLLEGQQIAAGQRIGMIRFGSQVDVFIPAVPGLKVLARPGMRLMAGATPIAQRSEPSFGCISSTND